MPIRTFANSIGAKFKHERGKEVDLFRKLCSYLNTTPAPSGYSISTEEYHGRSHLVEFAGDGIHATLIERCELADIMIIIERTGSDPKMVLIQAKKKRVYPNFCALA